MQFSLRTVHCMMHSVQDGITVSSQLTLFLKTGYTIIHLKDFFLVVRRGGSEGDEKGGKCAAGNRFFGCLFQNNKLYNCRHLPYSRVRFN